MALTDDSIDGLTSAVALANTAQDPDTLATLDDLAQFVIDHPYTGRIDRDDAELTSLRALRPRLRAMLLAPRDDMVDLVNVALAESTFTPRLTKHDHTDWHLHGVDDASPLAERILVETCMALIDVIRADEGSRITECEDATCTAIALDLSRNRSRRYCSVICANRNAVAAYRARRATG